MRIVLIGMRGAGKSTVGRALADALDMPFADTDELVRASAGMDIPTIFSLEGEPAFRRRERQAVIQALANAHAVIALGGGAITNVDTQVDVQRVEHVIWLKVSAPVLSQRLSDSSDRPRLTDLSPHDEIVHLTTMREGIYRKLASKIVSNDRGAAPDIAGELATYIRNQP